VTEGPGSASTAHGPCPTGPGANRECPHESAQTGVDTSPCLVAPCPPSDAGPANRGSDTRWWALLIAWALVLLALGGACARGEAATLPAEPELVSLQAGVQATVESALHHDIPWRVLQVSDTNLEFGWLGQTDGRVIVLGPQTAALLRELTGGARCTLVHLPALRILVHEELHPIHGGPWWVEEGVTEAVTQDVLQAVIAAYCPQTRGLSILGYPTRTKWVRAWSARYTGQRWQSRAARLARRELLWAGPVERGAMIASAAQ
jgi:hypothetical protein